MKYAILIAIREFAENAKTKGFWIGIFMLPLFLVVAIMASSLLANVNPTRHYFLVDLSGDFEAVVEDAVELDYQRRVLQAVGEYVREVAGQDGAIPEALNMPLLSTAGGADGGGFASAQAIELFIAAGGAATVIRQLEPFTEEDTPSFEMPRRRFVRLPLPADVDTGAGIDALAESLRPYLNGDERVMVDGERVTPFAALLIPPNVLDSVSRAGPIPAMPAADGDAIQYWSTNLTDRDLADLIGRALNESVRASEYVNRGVSLATVEAVEQTSIAFGSFDPAREAGDDATVRLADTIVRNATIGFVYLLWISIFMVLQILLNNTIEEKSNRIIEVLLSSVTSGELMMGKLLGIAAVGLTIVGSWLLSLYLGIGFYDGNGAEVINQVLSEMSSSGIIWVFFVYFLFGYLFYAGIFLSLGSLCNSLKEAQNLQGPLMMVMMVPLITMVFINRDPNGLLATIMTWIPLYTPFTMMNRAASNPPVLDLVGSITLMVGSTIVVLWLSGRVFRMGVLRTGQAPRLVEVLRWIRGSSDT